MMLSWYLVIVYIFIKFTLSMVGRVSVESVVLNLTSVKGAHFSYAIQENWITKSPTLGPLYV